MAFDKAKAMRNAERYVAQGRLRSAIDEYRSVVDADPRDIATLNMLGDLYAKNSEKRDAVNCYMQVAEHYSKQGFAQKAIAVYNKISRIQPDSIEVSAKLAELHKVKGSLAEARSHYTTLAEHYQKQGRRLEALSMYKQIALLDPNNTDVCMNLADSYMRENQKEEALEAYAEAGARFSRQNRHEEAIRALMKGYDIKATDLRILNGLVQAQSALGRATKAASLLEEIIENEPYNRDVLYLLIECCIDSQNAPGAEKAVIKLVEIEPANYSKFLDLIRIYLNTNDPDSAARILTMSAEYLLAGGQSDECGKWINEILERDPNQLAGLRLLVRYNTWLNDETGIRLSLERLYNAAGSQDSIEDEREALKQLVVIRPHETRYRDRLNEINAELGIEGDEIPDTPIQKDSEEPSGYDPAQEYLLPEQTSSNGNGQRDHSIIEGVERNGHILDAEIITAYETGDLSHADREKIQKELDSITFYIENDYNDLAVKALAELAGTYGDRPEFEAMRKRIGAEPPPEPEVTAEIHQEVVASTLGIDQIRSEFGLEESESEDSSGDYDTHYQMAVAYQEMGLMEDAIREYQDAIDLVRHDDGTRRFFSCANLLGHCFLQHGRPNHAITWFERALETPSISVEEYHGLWYELALAHEAKGDEEAAVKLFEKIYAENVDFRDVGERVRNLVAP
ncbi:MAG: tetratricopeptide repeat protein [Acidobacteria bacterium]|nr:tetratricopeptide repeat protein [Acidobacteriota bacterium]